MNSKRYQVFISSTYMDLEEERRNVTQVVMKAGCIPAGMKLFPAADEDQFDFIKGVIDDCDYYILIIAGRYGSLSPSGLSYTELEYDYAVSKQIKVIAFLHNNPNDIAYGKSETDLTLRERLQEFKKKVSRNRLVQSWSKREDLPGIVALSLLDTIRSILQLVGLEVTKSQMKKC